MNRVVYVFKVFPSAVVPRTHNERECVLVSVRAIPELAILVITRDPQVAVCSLGVYYLQHHAVGIACSHGLRTVCQHMCEWVGGWRSG